MSRTSVDLPDPETPVTVTKLPSGMLDVDVVEVVLAGPVDDQPLAGQRAARRGHRDLPAPDRYCPVIESLTLVIPLTGPL